jgi:hypothetical protein
MILGLCGGGELDEDDGDRGRRGSHPERHKSSVLQRVDHLLCPQFGGVLTVPGIRFCKFRR